MEMLSTKSQHLLLLAEHLRFRLHADREASLVRDRRYHLRTYSCCFIGRELVDWLVKHAEAGNRAIAVQCMCILQENSLIHHVCDDHMFKDEMLFYRFRRDDNSLILNHEIDLVLKGSDIYHKLTEDSRYVKPRQCQDTVYRNCFISTEMVDWLVENGEASDRVHAVMLGRSLMDAGLIKHVTNEHHFRDENLYYQFTIDKVVTKKLAVFLCPQEVTQPTCTTTSSPLSQRRNPTLKNQLPPLKTGQSSPVPFRKQRTIEDAVNEFRRSPGSPDISPSSMSPTGSSPRPVIVREVTVEELTDSSGPYTMKTIKIMSDAVGFGFVLRGTAPVYVQTVDPKGPAAAAGLKVRMFVRSVNGKDALYWSHKEVTEEVLRGQNVVELTVMTHFRGT